ncbi:hypothetical protein R50071_24810 [Halioxenophilus aromaticivorans]
MEARHLFSGGVEAFVVDSISDEKVIPYQSENHAESYHSENSNSTADQSQDRLELVIIDSNVEDYELLLEEITNQNSDQERNIEVVVLDNNRDGLSQLTDTLANYQNLDAVHLISHGDDGQILLGNSYINEASLISNFSQVSQWADAFSTDGEFLIYGCNLASTAAGQGMVDTLAALTDTDVAASDDITGNLDQGGDWELEYQTGNIETDSAIFSKTEWQGTLGPETLTGVWSPAGIDSFSSSTSSENEVGVTITFSTPAGTSVNNVTNDNFTNNPFFSDSAAQGATSLYAEYMWDDTPGDSNNPASSDAGTITVTINFDSEVVDPVIHIDRLGGVAGSTSNSSLWTVTTAGATLTRLSGSEHFDVTSNSFQRTPGDSTSNNSEASFNRNDGTAAGSLQVNGTYTSLTFTVTGTGPEGAGGDGLELAFQLTSNEPLITSNDGGDNALIQVTENTTDVTTVSAVDTQGQQISYSIVGGVDAGQFTIDSSTGDLTFVTSPDFEAPTDNNTDNKYEVVVRATDSSGAFDEQALTVNVNNATTGPTINSPGNQTTNEDVPLTFSNANGNALSLTADPSSIQELAISVDSGTLTLSNTNGLSFISGDGTADSSMLFTGTVEAINAALEEMTFTPAENSSATSSLLISVKDGDYAELEIDNNLLASFTFNAANPGEDSSPTGSNDATVVGATQITDPERETVLDFNGSSDYAQINGLMGNPNSVTLSAWVNVDAGETEGHIISIGDSIGLGLNSAGDQIHGWFYDGTSFNHTGSADIQHNIAGDGWHHITYTIDDATDTQRLYLDGVLIVETNHGTPTSFTLGTNTYLGSRDATSPEWAYSGLMDDARIYNRALTSSEAASLATPYPTDSDNLEVTVTPVNDAPVVSSGTGNFNYLETYDEVPLSGGVNITDVDSNDFAGGTLVYQVTNNAENEDRLALLDEGPGAGNVHIDGFNIYYSDVLVGTYTGPVTGSDPLVVTFNSNADLTAVNEVARNMTYENTSEDPVASTRTLEGYVTDGDGGTSNVISSTLTIVPVNDAPQGIDGAINVTEDTPYTFTLADFGYTDFENDSLRQVWFDTLPASGTLLFNGSPFAAGNYVDAADIDAGLLTYQPDADVASNNAASFTFRVQDTGGTANGGQDTDDTANTITINISNVNDAPAFTSANNLSSVENTTEVATVTTSDADGDTVTYTITGGVDASLFLIDSSTGELSFSNAPDYETPQDSDGNNIYQVQVSASDGNGATSIQSISVTVTDQALELVQTLPGDQTVAEDEVLTFSNANGNAVSVSDTNDSTDTILSVSLSVNNGTLDLASLTGITITAGGVNTNTITFTGKESDINAALNGMTFTPDTNYSGNVSLAMATSIISPDDSYYTFDGGSANDVSSSNNGSLVGDATTAVNPERGEVLSLDGNGDYVSINGLYGESQTVTLAAWVNIGELSNGGDVISLGGNVVLGINESGNGVWGGFYDGGALHGTVSSQSIAGDGWHHIAFVFDGSNNSQTLYIDGVAIASNNNSQSISYTRGGSDTTLGVSAETLSTNYFDGLLDDAYIATRALSADEIYALSADAQSVADSVAITITAVNDAPVISSPSGTYPYTEGDGAVVLGAAASVTDVDSADFDTGTLVYQITNNAQAEDRLDLLNEGPGAGNVNIVGTDIYYSDVLVGSYTGPVTGSTALTVTFNSNANSATVTQVMNNLTYENTSENPVENTRTLELFVTDGDGGSSDTVTGYVAVSGVNDAPTITNGSSFSVAENTTAITTVTSSDIENDTVTYAITGGADSALFSINSITGELTFATAPDYETPADADGNNSYLVEVTADDGNGGSDVQAVTVTVTDVNETPSDINPNSFAVTENTDTSGGYSVGTLTTTDQDAGDTFTYTIINGLDSAVFSIGGAGADELILTDGVLDFENQPSYQVTVRTTDSGGLSRDEIITVNVSDVNEAPSINSTAINNATEDSPYTYTITASDPDANSTLSFSAISLPTWLTLTDNNDGTATLTGTPTNDDVGSHSIDIQVSDGSLTDNQAFTLTVANTNDAPVITSPSGTYPYTEGAGAVVLGAAASVTDADGADFDTGTLVYQITNNAQTEDRLDLLNEGPGAGNVNIVGTDIYYSDVLVGSYTGPVTGSTALTVTFNSNATDTTVTQVMNNLTYENSSENPVENTRTLELFVTDGDGGTSDTVTGYVAVSGVNDAPTITNGSSFSVAENTTAVTTVTSSDIENDTVTYAITGGADSALFSINSITGELTFATAPDYETPADADGNNSYLVEVTADDGNGGSDVQAVTVTVTDVNETPSDINPNSFAVTENTDTSGGYSVGTLTTTDQDAGDTFTYTIINGLDSAVFSIGGAGADELILTDGVLDFENQPSYQVTVRTTDSGGLSRDEIITVNVSDVNEAPSINSTAITNATEDIPYTYTITASDPDANSTLSFSAISLPTWLTLTDNNDGTATLTGTPTNDDVGSHSIDIQVSDGSLTDNQAFTLTAANTNDAPVITSPSGTYPYTEGDGAVVLGAAASVADADGADFDTGTLVYQITNNAQTEDRLDLLNEGPGAGNVNIVGTDIYYSDVLVGSYTGPVTGSSALTVTFNNNATDVTVTQVMNNLTYENTSENPVENTRTLELFVTDGDGGTSDTVTGYVTVSGVNDAPTFTSGNSFSVTENDTAIGIISAGDAENQTLSYTISGGADQALFALDTNTGELTFINGADYELPADSNADNIYEVQISVSDTSGGTSVQQVSVTVTDENETPTDLSLSADSIDENTDASGGQAIGSLSTQDPDSGETFTYTIIGGPDQARFSLDGSNLVLTTSDIDYETDPSYGVTIQATDSAGHSITRAFVINVNDLNEAPEFDSTPITNGTEDSSYSYLITAQDQDNGASLTITATTLPGWLTLTDNGDGTATLTGTPTNADAGIHDVAIGVSDGNLNDGQSFTIAVTNTNDAPQFVNAVGPINGNFDNGLIGWASSGNVDTVNGEIRFGQVGGPAGTISQSITTQIGQTYYVAFDYGDRSATAAQSLAVDVTGASSVFAAEYHSGASENTLQTRVFSFVADSTSTTLTFTDTSASHSGVRGYLDNVVVARQATDNAAFAVQENTTFVTTVQALDEDFSDGRSYSISGGADQNLFTIDSVTGNLSLVSAPDHETPADNNGDNIYEVQVSVQDSSGALDTQSLHIDVTDQNENPNNILLSNYSVTENTASADGYSVGTLSTNDPDDGDTFTYAIVGGNDAGLFSIGGAGGNELIITTSNIDYETQANYQVTVRTTDSGGLSQDETITVSVSDENEGPTVESSAITITTEDSLYQYTLTASDPDANANLSYTATALPNWLNLIDHGDGSATLSGTPSNSDVGNHNITVQITDGTLTDTQSFTLQVINTNDAPVFTSPANFSVAENSATVTTLTTTDDDGDSHTFSITGGDDAALFSVNSVTGELIFTSLPNYENPLDSDSDNVYQLRVTAADGNGANTEQTLAITVTQVNEAPTMDAPGAFVVVENTDASSGYSLGSLSSNDPDAGDNISYTVVGGADGNLFSIGGINQDELILTTNSIDFEAQDSYQVIVRGTDNGGLSDDQIITINVADVNEGPSIVSEALTEASEDSYYQYTIRVQDPDNNNTLSVTTTSLPDWLILTNNGDGTATLNGTPSNSDVGNHEITVYVNDGVLSDTQTFTITVANTNDAPVFTNPTNITVAENTTAVTTLAVMDSDGDSTNFAITGGDDAALFDIDSATGELTFSNPPNFEQRTDHDRNNIYIVQITARDGNGGETSQEFSIYVENVNEQPIGLASNSFSVLENTDTTNGHLVGTLAAIDVDASDNHSFAIIGGQDAGYFILTGENQEQLIIRDGLLNHESRSTYELMIRITDNLGLTHDETVTVLVSDENEASVINSEAETTALENNYYSYTINAEDQDGETRLSFTAMSLPHWLTLEDHGDGTATISGTPTSVNVGNQRVEIQVSDGSLVKSQSFDLIVVKTAGDSTTVNAAIIGNSNIVSSDNTLDNFNNVKDANTSGRADRDHGSTIKTSPLIETDNSQSEATSNQANNNDSNQSSSPINLREINGQSRQYISRTLDHDIKNDTAGDENVDLDPGRSVSDNPVAAWRATQLADIADKQTKAESLHSTNITVDTDSDPIWQNIQRIQMDLDEDYTTQEKGDIEIEFVATAAVSFTAGVVSWLLRGGALLSTILSSAAVFQKFDPLTVVAKKKTKKDKNKLANRSDDRIESMFTEDTKDDSKL